MPTQIQPPNILGSVAQGLQIRDILSQRKERAEDRNFLMQQRAAQQKEKSQKDLYTTLYHLNPDMPDSEFENDFNMGLDWYAKQNPEDFENEDQLNSFKAMPIDEKRMFVQQSRNAMGIKPTTAKEVQGFTLSPGQKRFTGTGEEIAAVPKEIEENPEQWQTWGYGQMRNKATGEIEQVPVAPKAGETIRSLPDGGFEIIRGEGSKPKRFSEVQSKSGGFATRVEAANKIANELEDDPDFNEASVGEAIISGVPAVGNIMTTEKRQVYNQAKLDFVTAVLRLESGAAISDAEFEKENKKYFPQPGDKPEVIANKRKARERQFKILKGASQGAYDVIKDSTPDLKKKPKRRVWNPATGGFD